MTFDPSKGEGGVVQEEGGGVVTFDPGRGEGVGQGGRCCPKGGREVLFRVEGGVVQGEGRGREVLSRGRGGRCCPGGGGR